MYGSSGDEDLAVRVLGVVVTVADDGFAVGALPSMDRFVDVTGTFECTFVKTGCPAAGLMSFLCGHSTLMDRSMSLSILSNCSFFSLARSAAAAAAADAHRFLAASSATRSMTTAAETRSLTLDGICMCC